MYNSRPLPFAKDALTGISQKTLDVHYDKLYQGYVKKKNEIEERLKTTKPEGNGTHSDWRELKLEETFAANGVYLHEFYFDVLGGDGQSSGGLVDALAQEFGSFEVWVADFTACGMSARGWVVLGFDTKDGRLHNYNADMHNQGGVWGVLPIIVLDVYEHAYFIDYGADRAKYIQDYFKNLNWPAASARYEAVMRAAKALLG